MLFVFWSHTNFFHGKRWLFNTKPKKQMEKDGFSTQNQKKPGKRWFFNRTPKMNIEKDGFSTKNPKTHGKSWVLNQKPKKHMEKLVRDKKKPNKKKHCKTKKQKLLSQPHSFGFVVFLFLVFVLFTRIRDLVDFGDLSCLS